jgi:hypothetical protein
MQTDVNVPTICNMQKNVEKIYFRWHLEKPPNKIIGSRYGSGSVFLWYVFTGPGPFQNITDPEHWFRTNDSNFVKHRVVSIE